MLQKFRENKSLQGTLLIAPTLLWMFGLLIIPLLLTVIISFGRRDADGNVIYTFTLNNYLRLAGVSPDGFDPLYLQILWRSVTLAFQTTALVILLAYPLAYFVARAPAKNRNTLLFLILVPLWTNFVIRVYAWIMILRTQGVLNGVLGWAAALLHLPFQPLEMLYTPGAVLVGMVYEFLPFMILPIYTSLEKIDGSLFEAAADLGAAPARRFWRVTFPLSLPGVLAAFFLVFIPTVGEYVTPLLVGGSQGSMYGNIIQDFFSKAANWPLGSALSMIMLVVTMALVLVATRFVDLRRLIE